MFFDAIQCFSYFDNITFDQDNFWRDINLLAYNITIFKF